ncbi:MAG: hypothetical protein IJQ44_08130 [Bacteroidaceae bacterium]|nr:hypothetical protein [Bacteroidaceae bacterium]
MQQNTNILRGRPWLLLLLLFAWLLPQEAAATYVDEADNYTVSLGGSNIVYFEAPVYDTDDTDTWIEKGNLKVSVEGGSETTIFTWESETNIDNSNTSLNCKFSTSADGFFDITLGNSRSTARLTKSSERWLSLTRNSDNKTFDFSAEWVVPYNLLGKKLTFTWDVTRNGNSPRVKETVAGIKSKVITMPQAAAKLSPFISTPMLSPTNPGKLEIPWFMASDSITSAYYEYYDASGRYQKKEITNMSSGVIELDATVPHRNFRVVCSYKQAGDKGSYLIENQGSNTQNIPMVHAPVGLTALPLGGRKAMVEVTWNVPYLDYEDLTPSDFFEVQRSLTGKEEDFETIDQEFISKGNKQSTYTFIDSTLIEAIEAGMLKDGGTLDNLTYRVRRTITKEWGWGADNNCAASVRCIMDNLHLLRVANCSADWEDQRAYTVRVTWNYASEYNAVWDDRAQMVLRVMSKNSAGEVVDSLTYVLDQTERAQCYKVVNLTRSCVHYDIDMYVERGESPINYGDQVKEYYFPIRSAADWDTFRQKVEDAKNGSDVYARLYADITVSDYVGSSEGAPFRGIFDGNGYTLTFNKSGITEEYVAPFRYVGNASIRNLHTAGTISSGSKFIAGLIGSVIADANVYVESCRSSVTLNSSVTGEASNGGMVAVVNSDADISFRSCKFDGIFDGKNSRSHGGFVGWTNGSVTIENCLFAPTGLNTNSHDCETWARNSGKVNFKLINSYATLEFGSARNIVIRSAADWLKFVDLVEASQGQYTIDATLDADISIFKGVAQNSYYNGVFNGNGHTLDVDLRGDAATSYVAPFCKVVEATIKNLHVTGAVTSPQPYAAGLVGSVQSSLTIENCQSSVTLLNQKDEAMSNGGFVGDVRGTLAKVVISNSKFDGCFLGGLSYGHGGFVGNIAAGDVSIKNCLFAPDHIDTKTDQCETWARINELPGQSAKLSVTDCKATKYFGANRITIKSAEDWESLRSRVEQSKGASDFTVFLDADITVTTSVGENNDAPFRGTFNGNGHTLTYNPVPSNGDYVAPFRYVSDATFNSLHTAGTIDTEGDYASGLIAQVKSYCEVRVNSCVSSISITSNDENVYLAGFISRIGSSGSAVLSDCKFDGKFIGRGSRFYGFVGNNIYANRVGIINCFFAPEHNGNSSTRSKTWANEDYGLTVGNSWATKKMHDDEEEINVFSTDDVAEQVKTLGTGYWEVVDGKAVPKFSQSKDQELLTNETASQVVGLLGSASWQVVNNKAVPIMLTVPVTADIASEDSLLSNFPTGWQMDGGKLVPIAPKYEEINKNVPDLATKLTGLFYHKNTGTIDPELLTQTRQSSVLLSWNTDGNPIDYFIVQRRVKGEGDDAWKEIATNIDQLSYEDTSVSPLATYEYKVIGVNDCEGISTSETQEKTGECKHTGRLEGYVRYNDGTGAPDVEVDIIYDGKKVTSVRTDESGYFECDELSYQGKTAVDYKVQPVTSEVLRLEVDAYSVTFNATSNNETVHEFVITSGKRFSGFVMYDGTSIPVKGVNFLVNGRKIHNAKGDLVETDYDGSFSFRLMEGDNTIQAVMDNHVFTNDGWYKNSGKQNITSDVAGIYFYDATKVRLTGRVVGGDEQGSKPLLNNLSKNNLGDSLTIVLTLEGDNTSWLVYDNLNPNRTQREEVVRHPRGGDKHYTSVKTLRKRVEVTPDLATGEYTLMLPPVRWKVQQVYCTGYPTLFQEGQVSEVIDLTNCLTPKDTTYMGVFRDVDTMRVENPTASYHAVYNRIFHNPVEVTYKQLGYDTFNYFGDKSYMATELNGDMAEVPLAYPNPLDSTQALYSFDYPVFSMERQYRIQLQVAERYLYNNNPATGKIDLVTLGGGKARMQNGMKAFSDKALFEPPVEIDSLGRALFTLKADQTTTLLTGLNALKTVSFTVERDGTFYEAAPLHGYVLNMFPVGEAKTVLSEGQPVLFDILRDPPGSYSTNTLAKGATLNYTYMMNLSISAGLYFSYKEGKKLQTVSASVVAPQGSGTAVGPIYMGDAYEGDVDQLMYNAQGSKAFSYTMALNNAVSTSGDPSMVGADADVYIGTVQNVVVTPMSTIRAVTDSMYNAIIARTAPEGGMVSEVGKTIDYGTVVEIASGTRIGKNGKEEKFHLIRDVALGYGPKVQSQFVYSQKQILTQIIPDKAKEIVDLMYLGTKEDAQKIANSTQRPVYLSLREPTDSLFAVVNSKKIDGHAYNDTIDKAEKGINYLVVLPKGKTSKDFSDEVIEKYQTIKAWIQMIAQNEGEKMTAHDLVANYDVAGTAGVNYSESFASNYSTSWMNYFPIATQVDYFGAGSKALTYYTAATSLGVTLASSIALSLQEMKTWTTPTADGSNVNMNRGTKSEVYFSGDLFQWTLVPVALFNTVGADSQAKAYTRTESFTIAPDASSHLNVDVYRTKIPVNENDEFAGVTDVFTNFNYNTLTEDVQYYVQKALKEDKIQGPRGFVFRTRGGSTANPWEDERKTQFYDPGKVLDARTLKICNPKIRLDKQSVSGVSVNDAAHFVVFVSNESEKPEATDGLTTLQLFAADQLNPNGAKISINGQPLTTGGMTITVVPGTETMLQMEVRAGQGFDYEKLGIGVMSPTDPENAVAVTTFDVHFLREAGGVNIAAPGDKWVLNTMAQVDSKRGWYLPVTINGFDRHQHNFDHIEFQYKESQRGDDSWTNLCSFYASDSLMAGANGVCKLIPENGNIVTEFYGDGWVMERSYDLRAVLFCRNGSDFLTTPSKVITGIKDTRRPQLFGTPEPKNGLLFMNEDIVFNFSEDIEHNNLSAITNFEVKGEVNNNSLSEMVSVQFSGQASVETEARRNFSGKDLTIDMMIKPAETGRDMPLFSHGTNGQKLQLWLTKDFKLKAVVGDQTFVSDSVIGKNAFRQVAVTLNQTDSLLTFFKGGVEIGRHKLSSLYNGTGTLIFGRTNEQDRTHSQFYEGRMMEARLWYRAMDGGLIGTTYGGQRLTGYEKDLVDYYPMNEGSGLYVKDCTQGANALMMGASWAIPHGLSLRVQKSDKGVLLDKNALNRTADQDYSLMFWFRTDADGRGTLLSNGRGLKEDNGAENLFRIGFDDSKLTFRSNGIETEVPGNWSDGQWHNFAMTVSRGRNVANIYMDKELVTTFEADSLGGISGGYPLIGATRYNVVKENGEVEVIDGDDALTGNVDELMFFAQALPQQLISTYATKSPNGDESGLLTYLGFDRIERQKDNDLVLVPYAYSKKLYLDDKGQPRYQLDPLTKEPTDTLVRDYLFADSVDVVLQHFDKEFAAPVVPNEEVKNLKFSFIGRNNQLLVDLDEPAARLNHRNIYVTVRDIEDRNGNTLASPQTASYFVVNSSLEWALNRLDYTIKYGSAEVLDLPFYNHSAMAHNYTIENCPRWLTLSKYNGDLAPLSLDAITATVNKDLNIGTYNEIIYLTDEDGLTEPFYLNLTVEGEQPDWANSVSGELLANSMSISGQVFVYDELDTDSRDIVGAFDNENVCHGFANISHDVQSGETALYLTVYDSKPGGRDLNFRLWQYNTGRELVLTTTDSIKFEKGAVLGTDKPVRFDARDSFVQYFNLNQGWNWVSFNIDSPQLRDVNTLLNRMAWNEGDILTALGNDTTLVYKNNRWMATDSTKSMVISPKKSYAIKVQQDCKLPVGGTAIKAEDDRTITVNPGWNAIGYTPLSNLTLETALSDYFDQAQQGDVIKSHTEFAYFTKVGNTGRWRGSLQYMKPGEGYMLLRKGDSDAEFTYPYFEQIHNFHEEWMTDPARSAAPHRSTMSLSATVVGFEPEEGDVLVAYADGEAVGEGILSTTSEPAYLSIAGDAQQKLWFAVERDGEIVASTPEVMLFRTNAVVGTPDEPTAINFVKAEYENDQWYTISGMRLPKKPTQRGLYIFNGKKVVVK